MTDITFYDLYNRRVIKLEELETRLNKAPDWNWSEISAIPALPEEFIEKYADNVDWSVISAYVKLTEAFVEKHEDKIVWKELLERYKPPFSVEFFIKHVDKVGWYDLTKVFKLTNAQIEQYGSELDFYNVLRKNNKVKYSLLDKFSDRVYWDLVTPTQTLTEKFMRDHEDLLCWSDISMHQKLSESFMTEFADNLDWYELSVYQHMSNEFIEKHKTKVHPVRVLYNDFVKYNDVVMSWNDLIDKYQYYQVNYLFRELVKDLGGDAHFWVSKLSTTQLTETEIINNIKYFPWCEVIQEQKLTEDFIVKHLKKFRLMNIFVEQEMSEDFLERYAEEKEWYWNIISMNQKMTESFIEKYGNLINWRRIGVKFPLSEQFMNKHADKLDWDSISIHQKFSDTFIEQHKEKIDSVRLKYNKSFIYNRDAPKCKDPALMKHFSRFWNLDEEITWNDLIDTIDFNDIHWIYNELEADLDFEEVSKFENTTGVCK